MTKRYAVPITLALAALLYAGGTRAQDVAAEEPAPTIGSNLRSIIGPGSAEVSFTYCIVKVVPPDSEPRRAPMEGNEVSAAFVKGGIDGLRSSLENRGGTSWVLFSGEGTVVAGSIFHAQVNAEPVSEGGDKTVTVRQSGEDDSFDLSVRATRVNPSKDRTTGGPNDLDVSYEVNLTHRDLVGYPVKGDGKLLRLNWSGSKSLTGKGSALVSRTSQNSAGKSIDYYFVLMPNQPKK